MAAANLPAPSKLSLGARFQVRDSSPQSCGVYLTIEDARTVATYYRGRILELNASGIPVGEVK